MGKQFIDWIAALVLLRALLVVLGIAVVRWALAKFAPQRRQRSNRRQLRIRRRPTHRRSAADSAVPLDQSSN